MDSKIEFFPSYAWVKIELTAGESIDAEAGAMVTMSPSVAISTRLNGGKNVGALAKVLSVVRAISRKVFGGETMFINHFDTTTGGQVVLAPSLSGSVVQEQLADGRDLFVQRGSYLASTGDVTTVMRWGGLRSLFGGEGLVLLRCSGTGTVFLNSYGDVVEIAVDGDYTVDTGHIVAFDGSLTFSVGGTGGVKSFLFSGEGLVCKFKGRGRVWIQSRNISQTVSWLGRYLT